MSQDRTDREWPDPDTPPTGPAPGTATGSTGEAPRGDGPERTSPVGGDTGPFREVLDEETAERDGAGEQTGG